MSRRTGGPRISSSGFNGQSLPALDSIKDALLLFALRCEARYFLAADDGLAGRRVDDAWEDGAAMTAARC